MRKPLEKRCGKNTMAVPRGMTLIETVVLMSLTAVLSGIIVTGLAAMYRYNRSTNSHQVSQTALQQMTTTLRADIHEATRCQWNAESQTLSLELPESQTLRYHKVKKRWVRVLSPGEAKPITTSFGIDDSFHGFCQTDQVNQGELIRLILINQPLELPKEKFTEDENFPEDYEEEGRTERTLRSDIVTQVGRDSIIILKKNAKFKKKFKN